MKLLVCIAFHYNAGKLGYLLDVINYLKQEYEGIEVSIIIDTNTNDIDYLQHENNNTFLKVFNNLLFHPFHLTWLHRKHIHERLDSFDWFMYIEDDMYLPFKNFKNYIENFYLLFPKYIPSFIRLENIGREYFVTDVVKQQPLKPIKISGKIFTELESPYHAFWIMPQKELKETMTNDFIRFSDSRETAASYPMWELKKTPLVEIQNNNISPLCYSFHLPNTYAKESNTPHAKIKVNNIFL